MSIIFIKGSFQSWKSRRGSWSLFWTPKDPGSLGEGPDDGLHADVPPNDGGPAGGAAHHPGAAHQADRVARGALGGYYQQ